MNLKQLRQFLTIAEEGSFRRAADRLFIAQPALSLSIKNLEKSLNAQLFLRTQKGVLLSAAGFALVDSARSVLAHAEQARKAVDLAAHGSWGVLTLGFVGMASYRVLPEGLPRFRASYPHIQLELREGDTLTLTEQVRENRIDAALVRGPIAEEPLLQQWTIEHDDLILAVPSSHPFSTRKSMALREASTEAFVMYSQRRAPGLRDVAISQCIQAGFIPRICQEAVQVQTVVSLVASGLGIALTPATARVYPNQHVRFLSLTDKAAKNSVCINYIARRDTKASPVSRLLECLLPVA
ncbi:MAG: LysR family transcriptional regulator [Candidimonas sp.]|nr:LysR family transcriptional regulator [Candidimonas sp.]